MFSCTAFFFGCKTDEIDNTLTKADISGSVKLYDEGTNPLPKDGMIISVEGSNPLISSVSDTNGDFVLNDVPFGTYIISFQKTGYGTFKNTGLKHRNTGSITKIIPDPALGQRSTTTITVLTSSYTNSNVKFTITTYPAAKPEAPRYYRVFFSPFSNVSFNNYIKYTGVTVCTTEPAEFSLGIKDIIGLGFNSGDTFYATVYGDSYWSNDYDNPATGKREFPNLNSTTTASVSFIVP